MKNNTFKYYRKIIFVLVILMISILFSIQISYADSYSSEVTYHKIYMDGLAVCIDLTLDVYSGGDEVVIVRGESETGPYYVANWSITEQSNGTTNITLKDFDAPIGKEIFYKIYYSEVANLDEMWIDSSMEPLAEFSYFIPEDKPPIPEIIEVEQMDGSSVYIKWNKIHNVDGYRLYVYNQETKEFEILKQFNHDYNYTYTDELENFGEQRIYCLTSYIYDSSGNMLESEKSTDNDGELGVLVPETPKLKLRVVGTKTVKLSWNKIKLKNGTTTVDGYRIYEYDSAKKKYVLIKTIKDGNTTTWKHTNLTTGKKRTYKITSFVYNEEGKIVESKKSTKKSATPRKNKYTEKADPYFYDDEYGEVILRTKEVSYVDGKIQYKALALNNRIFYANKFNWIEIKIYDDNKMIAKQKFYNKSIGLSGYNSKTMTFLFNKGTKVDNCNLRYADIDVIYDYVYTYSY